MTDTLAARGVTLGYDGHVVATDLDVIVPANSFTAIIGPNACGKSTLLRALSRLLAPTAGTVVLDGRSIAEYSTRDVARRLGLMPQSSVAPAGITVADLVARGRFPHQTWLRQWSQDDERVVLAAMTQAGVADLADQPVDQLSGGQRQRVWLALVLAQETSVLLLDEPTTFLDIAHQIEVLRLCRRLHARGGTTLVAVLHDLNMAFRYADHVVAMKDGRVVTTGTPDEVGTAELVSSIYDVECVCIPDPVTGRPMVIPLDTDPRPTAAIDDEGAA